MLTVKTDSVGNTIFRREYQNGTFSCVQETNDGGFVLIGSYWPLGSPNEVGRATWMIRTDSYGDTLWFKKMDTCDNCISMVIQDSDGGFVYTGTNVTIAKTDSLGNPLWQRTVNAGIGTSIIKTLDGGYLIGGDNGNPIQLTKYNNNADTSWTVNTSIIGHVNSIFQSHDSSFIFAGYTGNVADAFVAKLDANGKMIWNRSYGGNLADQAVFITETEPKKFLVCGQKNYCVNCSYQDVTGMAWIFEINEKGEVAWDYSFNLDDHIPIKATAIFPTNDSLFTLAGQGWVSYKFGELNAFLTRIGKSEKSRTIDHLPYEPIRAKSVIGAKNSMVYCFYELYKNSSVKSFLYNSAGRTVRDLINEYQAPNKYHYNWNVDDLPSGVYYLYFEANQTVQAIKVILTNSNRK
jgi:hypothetical protein